MTFHMDILKECFPTWVHLRILETLMHKPKAMSQRQLASVVGIPRATVQRALNDLGDVGLIKPHRIGSATYWDFEKRGYLYEVLAPVLEGLTGLTLPLAYLKRLVQQNLRLPKHYRCVLFGSTVSGQDTPTSDIDLCIILPGNLREPPPGLENQRERLEDLCREKFGKTLSIIFTNEKWMAKNFNQELTQNISKGMEIS